jgi:hypothetical protein
MRGRCHTRRGRRNRYQIQAHLPLPESTSRERTVREVLALLTGDIRAVVTDGGHILSRPGT